MVTWTFDLIALIVGFLGGFMIGALIVLFITFPEEHDAAEWGKGYKAGAETVKEVYTRAKEDSDAEIH